MMRSRSGTASLNPYYTRTLLYNSLQTVNTDTGALTSSIRKPLRSKMTEWTAPNSTLHQEWRQQTEGLVAELCRETIDNITQALQENPQQTLADIIEPPMRRLVFQLLHVSDFFPDDELNDIAGKFSLYNLAAIELLSLCYPEVHNINTQAHKSAETLQAAYQTHITTQETIGATGNHHALELLLLGKLTKQYDAFPAQTDPKQKRRFSTSKKNTPLPEATATATAEQAQTLTNGIYIDSSIYYLTAYDVKLMHQLAAQHRFADRPDEKGATVLTMLVNAFEGDDESKLLDDLLAMIENVLPMINKSEQQAYLSSTDSDGKNLVDIALAKKLGRTATYLATKNKTLEDSLQNYLTAHNLTQATLLVECYAKDQTALMASLEKIDLSDPMVDEKLIATLFAKCLYRAAAYIATKNGQAKKWVESRISDLHQSPLNDKQLLALIDAEILTADDMLELTLQAKGRTEDSPYSTLDNISLLARLIHAASSEGSIEMRIDHFDNQWDYPDSKDYQQQMLAMLENICDGSYLPSLVGGSMPRTTAQQTWHAVLFSDEGPLSAYLQRFEHGNIIIKNAKHYAQKLTTPANTAAPTLIASNTRRQTYGRQSLREKGPTLSFKRRLKATQGGASLNDTTREAFKAKHQAMAAQGENALTTASGPATSPG